jgi:hypothetical protein
MPSALRHLVRVAFLVSTGLTLTCVFAWPISSIALTRSSANTTRQLRLHQGRVWLSAATNGGTPAPLKLTVETPQAANPWPGRAALGAVVPTALPTRPSRPRTQAQQAAWEALQAKLKDEELAYQVRKAVQDDSFLGISLYRGDVSLYIMPLWLPMACVAVFQTWWLANRRRWRMRVAYGWCVACGYDLRASLERCPECGRESLRHVEALPALPKVRRTGRRRTRTPA